MRPAGGSDSALSRRTLPPPIRIRGTCQTLVRAIDSELALGVLRSVVKTIVGLVLDLPTLNPEVEVLIPSAPRIIGGDAVVVVRCQARLLASQAIIRPCKIVRW